MCGSVKSDSFAAQLRHCSAWTEKKTILSTTRWLVAYLRNVRSVINALSQRLSSPVCFWPSPKVNYFIIVVKSLVFQFRLYVCRRFLAQSSIIEYHLPHLLSECRYLEFIWKTGKFHLYNRYSKESRISYLKKFTNVD